MGNVAIASFVAFSHRTSHYPLFAPLGTSDLALGTAGVSSMIWIGTSGYNYPEWKGNFYPAGLAAAKMLPVLRGAISDRRDQLHVLPRAEREDPPRVEQRHADASS